MGDGVAGRMGDLDFSPSRGLLICKEFCPFARVLPPCPGFCPPAPGFCPPEGRVRSINFLNSPLLLKEGWPKAGVVD